MSSVDNLEFCPLKNREDKPAGKPRNNLAAGFWYPKDAARIGLQPLIGLIKEVTNKEPRIRIRSRASDGDEVALFPKIPTTKSVVSQHVTLRFALPKVHEVQGDELRSPELDELAKRLSKGEGQGEVLFEEDEADFSGQVSVRRKRSKHAAEVPYYWDGIPMHSMGIEGRHPRILPYVCQLVTVPAHQGQRESASRAEALNELGVSSVSRPLHTIFLAQQIEMIAVNPHSRDEVGKPVYPNPYY